METLGGFTENPMKMDHNWGPRPILGHLDINLKSMVNPPSLSYNQI